MAKQQPKPSNKATSNKVTKQFPVYDRQASPQQTKTTDSLKKAGYNPDPNSVKRIAGTNKTSITFVKKKK